MPKTELGNPFCNVPEIMGLRDFHNRNVVRIDGGKYDPETGCYTPTFVDVDLEAEIESCKDMCGVALMKNQLARGLAKPEDFYDDGRSGVDVSQIPATVHEANAKANEASQQLAELAKALGLKDGETYSASQFEDALAQAVAKAVQAQAAKPATEGGSSNE